MKKALIAIAAILLLGGCKNNTEVLTGTSETFSETASQTETAAETTAAAVTESTAEAENAPPSPLEEMKTWAAGGSDFLYDITGDGFPELLKPMLSKTLFLLKRYRSCTNGTAISKPTGKYTSAAAVTAGYFSLRAAEISLTQV